MNLRPESIVRCIVTWLLCLWINSPQSSNHRMYRAALILKNYRPRPHDGLCKNFELLVTSEKPQRVQRLLAVPLRTWPLKGPSAVFPVPGLGYAHSVSDASAYYLASLHGMLYDTTEPYGRARMHLLAHITQHFEDLYLDELMD